MPDTGFERDHQFLEDESGINKKKNVMLVRKGRNACCYRLSVMGMIKNINSN